VNISPFCVVCRFEAPLSPSDTTELSYIVFLQTSQNPSFLGLQRVWYSVERDK